MATSEPESLESLLNKATNPANAQEDWEAIMAFCDQINKELEGPQISVRLLAHKIQSPQAKESLYALATLESCVKNCGKRFHQEIGKFRFLNEIIKVISPKYLGNHVGDNVKKRCIELLYSWSQGLKHEPKIEEAYQMLKRQGIVKEDPTYVDKTFEPPPPPRDKSAIFDDEEKSKLLARLLKSKHPEDLQAANRLIKNMVKQDIERMEKASKRVQELETVTNNIQLLGDMLNHYSADTATSSELDVMKELYDNIEKRRPNLFRLASDTSEAEADAMGEILKVNDDVVKVMTQYKKIVEGKTEENGLDTLYDPKPKAEIQGPPPGQTNSASYLLDLQFGSSVPAAASSASSTAACPPSTCSSSSLPGDNAAGDISLLDDTLGSLGIGLTDISNAPATSGKADLDQLGDIFNSAASQQTNTSDAGNDTSLLSGLDPLPTSATNTSASTGLLDLNPPTTQPPFYSVMPQPPLLPTATSTSPFSSGNFQPGMFSAAAAGGAGAVTGILSSGTTNNSTVASPTPAIADKGLSKTGSGTGLEDLSSLGDSLMQQSLASTGKTPQAAQKNSAAAKVPMNQLPKPTPTAAIGISPLGTPTHNASPAKTAAAATVQPLTDVFVPLESIQPGTTQPLNPFDKHNVKVMMHIGKDRPREDVVVVVISAMSNNTTAAVKGFSFQAAVPKSMKVKLQPASASDLPVYNPILPPAAITQVMLIANPQKEKIRLKYKVTFALNNETITDVGDVDNFPVQ